MRIGPGMRKHRLNHRQWIRLGWLWAGAIAMAVTMFAHITLARAADTAFRDDGDIPVMKGATVIKQKIYEGSASLELTTAASPDQVTRFYNEVMTGRGWPSGMIMTVGHVSRLVHYHQGQQFVVAAQIKDGATLVKIALIRPPGAAVQTTGRLPQSTSKRLPDARAPASGTVTGLSNRQLPSTSTQELPQPPPDSAPASDQAPAFTAPDFQVTDVVFRPEQNRIRAQLRNGSKPYHGDLVFRVQLYDDYSPYTLDRTVTVTVHVRVAESIWVTLLSDFQWPALIEYPALNIVVAVDSDHAVSETDETNNGFRKTLRVPCHMTIGTLANAGVATQPASYAIPGTFGSRRAGRFICLEKDHQQIKVPIRAWANHEVVVRIEDLDTGIWDLVAYCSDPDTTQAYVGNRRQLEIRSNDSGADPFSNSGAFDAGDMATQMADGYESWFESLLPRIKKVWVAEQPEGVMAHCLAVKAAGGAGAGIQKPSSVIMQIFQQDFRCGYAQTLEMTETQDGHLASYLFKDLEPGIYTFKCGVTDDRNNIVSTQSMMFQNQ